MKNRPDNIRSKKYLILSGKKLTDNIRKKNNPIFLKIYLIPITDNIMYFFKLILSCFFFPDIIRSFFDLILSDYQILSDNQIFRYQSLIVVYSCR